MNEEEIKKRKDYCVECGELLATVPMGFDVMSFLEPITLRYCVNHKCRKYGDVTVLSTTNQ